MIHATSTEMQGIIQKQASANRSTINKNVDIDTQHQQKHKELFMNSSKQLAKPVAAIIAVNMVWGLDFIAIEYMMEQVSPHMFTLIRLIIGSLILSVLVFIKRGGLHIKREDLLRVFIAGSVGMAVYFTIENLGTGLTSASFSSLIMATVPIFGMIGDRLVFGNRITVVKIIGIIASIIGVYMLVSGEPMGINMTGFAAMLVSAILWAFYIVYTKPLFERYDLLTLLTGLFLSGLITQIPIAIVSQGISHAEFNMTRTGAIVTVVTAIVCIIIGEFLYVYAIGKLSPTTTSAFENVLPVTTVLFSFLLFGKSLTGLQIIGGLVIMVAVTVITLTESKTT